MTLLWFPRYHPEHTPIPVDSTLTEKAVITNAIEISRSAGCGIVAASVRPNNQDKAAPQLELGLDALSGLGFVSWHSRAIPTRRPRRLGYLSLDPDYEHDDTPVPYRYDDNQETTLPRSTQIRIPAIRQTLTDFRHNPEQPSNTITWSTR